MVYKIFKSLILPALSIAAITGCTGNEAVPNNATQTGIVTGALAGSVIGYNSGHHHGTNAALGAVAGAAAGGLIGNAIDSNNPPPQDTGGWHE